MNYRVEFARGVRKEVEKLPKQARRRLYARIESLGIDPRPQGCKKLVGADDLWRVRVGDYRVIYSIDDGLLVVFVVKVTHRRDAYD